MTSQDHPFSQPTLVPKVRRLPPVTGVEPISVPMEAACSLSTNSSPGAQLLKISPGSDPYATALSPLEKKVWIPIGHANHEAFLEVETRGLFLQGYAQAKDLALYAARPLLLAGCMLPSAEAKLDWISAIPGTMTFTFPMHGLTLVDGSTSFDRACDDLSLSAGDFDVEDGLGEIIESLLFKSIERVPLRTDPAGPVVAFIHPKQAPSKEADVVEVLGDQSRILWWMDDVLVFGWVSTDHLKQPEGSIGTGFGVGGLGLRGRGTIRWSTCEKELPLVVAQDGYRRVAGVVKAQTRWNAGAEENDWVEVELEDAGARLVNGAKWLVPRQAIQACQQPPSSS